MCHTALSWQLGDCPLLKGVISSLFWLLGLLGVNVLESDQFKKNLIDEGLAPIRPKTKAGFGLWLNATYIMEDFWFSDLVWLSATRLVHSTPKAQ